MDHFLYKDGALHAEDVALSRIADALGTPFYCYSTATLVRHYRVLREALDGIDARIHYAVKANGNLAVIRTLALEGAGADVVSAGEITRALAAGVPADEIVFSGVGKTRDEMALALDAGVGQINIESEAELAVLSEVAAARGVVARIAIRINPDIDAATHDKISTGRAHDKFGIAWPGAREVCARAARLPGIDLTGIAVHIGSQLVDLGPFERAFAIAADAVRALRADGHTITTLDLGGGLGVPYGDETPPSPQAYGAVVKKAVAGLDCRVFVEPGRVLVANAGVLVTRVVLVKNAGGTKFLIVDAAMNDLLRPSLYAAEHTIVPVREPAADAPLEVVDIVGPVCESGDILRRSYPMPGALADDLLAVRTAGAYGAVMASTYNGRLLVPEVLVNGDQFAVVRPRPDYDAALAGEILAPWHSEEASRGVA